MNVLRYNFSFIHMSVNVCGHPLGEAGGKETIYGITEKYEINNTNWVFIKKLNQLIKHLNESVFSYITVY